jgi:hypothetical protein
MINNELMSKFQDSKLVNAATIKVSVSVDGSEMESIQAQKLLSEFNRMAPYAGFSAVTELDSKDIEKYLRTLKWMRVCTVSGNADNQFRQYRTLAKVVAVPVLEYQILVCIGNAYDKDYNLEFNPACNVTEDDILSPAEMEAISSLFRQFENSGMKVVYGIPKAQEGDLDFMAMSHVSDAVVSYRRSHPVYGFLASFIRQQQLNEVTGMMSRVVYGYESDYRYQIDALINAING